MILNRPDMVTRQAEAWQPPAFTPQASLRDRAIGAARRGLDLQAASIHRDLKLLLAGVDGTLVDVGCGAQPYRPLLGAGVRYVGIDTEDARENFGYEMPDTRYFAADGRWPVADAEADVLLCTETLEHVYDSAAFLAEAARVLRPGGRVVMTVPFAARWHYVPHDYWRFTPSALARLLGAAGFTDVRVHARGDERAVAAQKVMALVLPLLMPQGTSAGGGLARRLAGLALAPVVLACAIVGQRSLRGRGGEDCLGYTVLAVRD